jgi:hypothetical protein
MKTKTPHKCTEKAGYVPYPSMSETTVGGDLVVPAVFTQLPWPVVNPN